MVVNRRRYVTLCACLRLVALCSIVNDGVLVLSLVNNARRIRNWPIIRRRWVKPDTQISRSDIRGDKYGASNSTIPTATEAATAVGVKPPRDASSFVWTRAWRLHRFLIPWLHRFDKLKPTESSYSLQCLWNKALSGNDPNSLVFDNSLAYDVLPSGTRVLVCQRLRRFYPRLHHANIEIRTAFLDQAVADVIDIVREENNSTAIQLVSLGAGYDTRSIKFMERGLVQKVVELDLTQVIEAKSIILSERVSKRRPWLQHDMLPEFYSLDMNEIDEVERTLRKVLKKFSSTYENVYTIFLLEGVMIYLDDGVPSAVLGAISRALRSEGLEGTLCFADRLENVPGGDMDLGRKELEREGWEMTRWQPKPGLARHMGCAKLLSTN